MMILTNHIRSKRVDFPGGYFDKGGVHWLLRDGLGSVGMTVDDSGKVEQHVQYYPYGEPHREPQGQPYLYGGKERRRFGGLNDYDFHARFLNPAAALWHAPDPHASRYPWLSPYAFCASNPVRYSDPTGNIITTMIDGKLYTYECGRQGWNFYYDGEKYDGDNQYVAELLRSLRTLQCKAVGNALVRSLVEDIEVITIRAPQDGESNMYDHSSRTIVWDSNKKSWGNYTFDGGKWTLQKPAFLSLAHEMFHTESFLSGYTPKIWGYIGGEPYFTDDIWAITGENLIMHEQGLHGGEYGLGYRIGYGIIGSVSDDFPYGTKEPMYFEYEQCKEYFDNNTDVVRRINTNASMRKFQRQYGIKQN